MEHIAQWDKESSQDETIKFVSELASVFALKGGAQGKLILDFISLGDFLSVCDFDVDYSSCTAYEAGNCRQAISLFSKLVSLDFGQDKRKNAIQSFMEAEAQCFETNDLLRKRAQGSVSLDPWVESVIFRAQSKIARVLGECPPLEALKPRFGPGATTLTKKRKASVVEKLQAGISCSEDLLPYASRILEEFPHLADLHSDGCEYSRLGDKELCRRVSVVITNDIVDFVPKNAKTHRTITKGGTLNMMVQLAYGDYMSKRLAAFGVDLKDQEHNQKYALEGSLRGNYATLDLKSASDTISTELVYTLLPVDWALALDVCRSSKVELDGRTIQLEKFSSMGNGFTFPLESLIFWALSSCASDDNFASVYGDDIIVTTRNVDAVKRILTTLGFTLNAKKSYWSGPFRESCGADYFRGIDIRPCYQKDLISPVELFRLHNFFWRDGNFEVCDLIRAKIHPSLRIYGPDGFGDGHLLGDWTPRRHKRHKSHGYGGVLFDTFKLTGVRDKRALRPGDRILPLYSIYIRENAERVLPEELESGFEDTSALARLFGRIRKFQGSIASEPIPERVSPVDLVSYKTPSYPGTDGYKRVTIYTLDIGR